MKHSYWIPTNRDIRKSLQSYVEEISYCIDKYSMDIPLYVLDSGDQIIEEENRKTIAEFQIKYQNIKLIHIPFKTQEKIVSYIISTGGLDKKYQLYFTPRTVNYGAVMNKIYLIAAALGYDVLHRRDSDTVLQENCPYPLELEIDNIGKVNSNFKSNRKVAIVGSGYVGEWNLDIKDFVVGNDDLFHVFLSCLNIPAEGHEDFMNETYKDCKKYFKEDEYQYVIGRETKMPEAGNFAIYDLFRKFPCLPADFTLGSDYFTFKMAISFEYPVLFHERRVFHSYHNGRKSDESMKKYIKSLAKFCDHSPVYWYFVNMCILPYMKELSKKSVTIDSTNIEEILEYLADGLDSMKTMVLDARKNNLINLAENFLPQKYPQEAKFIKEKIDEIMEECIMDYSSHAELLKNWNKIVNTAEENKAFIEGVLNSECK